MEITMRRNHQAAFNFHALAVGEAARNAMEFSEGEAAALVTDLEAKVNGAGESICTKGEARAVLEYLKGRPLSVRFKEGGRTIMVPLAFDKYDQSGLLAAGKQVLALPIHRLQQVAVGGGKAQRFTFESPTGAKKTGVSSLEVVVTGVATSNQALPRQQKLILDTYGAAHKKLGGFRVPTVGDNVPPLAEVFGHLVGQLVAIEWIASVVADPAWRGNTGWLQVETVEGDAACLRIGGAGWIVEVRNVLGWRVGASGITIDTQAPGAEPCTAITLQLIK